MIPLAALALRRALSPPVAAALVLLLALLAAADWGVSAISAGGTDLGGAAARQGVWLVAALVLVPAVVLRAGSVIPRWRRADAAWLAPRGRGASACLAATLAGLILASALALVGFYASAEWAAGGSGPAPRHLTDLHHAPLQLVGRDTVSCSVEGLRAEDLTPGSLLRLRPTVAPGNGPSARVRLEILAEDEVLAAEDLHLARRTAVLLSPRAGRGELVLRLTRLGGNAYVALPDHSAELLVAGDRERASSAILAAHLLSILLPLSALALGLGAWMRGSLAAFGALSLWLLPWMRVGAADWLPGAGLARALEWTGDRVVAPWPGLPSLGVAAATVLLGLALARRGLSSWGRTG